jgi:hypothetical protein
MRREVIMVVMVQCHLMGCGYMEIVISGNACARNRHKEYL